MLKVRIQDKTRQVGEKLVFTSRTHEHPNGTRPGGRRSERSLSTYHARRKCYMEINRKMVKFGNKIWSNV